MLAYWGVDTAAPAAAAPTTTTAAPASAAPTTAAPATAAPATAAPAAPSEQGCRGRILGVSLFLDLTHTYAGELDIDLIAPDGARAGVLDFPNSHSDFIRGGYTFSDDPWATSAIPNTDVWGPGAYQPAQSFVEAFGLRSPEGAWTLRIEDCSKYDFGVLYGCAPRQSSAETAFATIPSTAATSSAAAATAAKAASPSAPAASAQTASTATSQLTSSQLTSSQPAASQPAASQPAASYRGFAQPASQPAPSGHAASPSSTSRRNPNQP
ncbi:hypothetical protein GPECTOR_155g81 [Gonium pectorale]|uniref:P/Homo B domain-containing protein n=1 Tax=Gonium pectorale TaxID=33097 RepID=A0A150FXM6_GONPE|nr:hypothetical protein GPECTOR_155g81 [Gonium pectorale]|eukprot:KXZ42371.1 hypothetical protein GPECTOR_155g81 [Gonium pectorale]